MVRLPLLADALAKNLAVGVHEALAPDDVFTPDDVLAPGDVFTPDDVLAPGDVFTPDDVLAPGDVFAPENVGGPRCAAHAECGATEEVLAADDFCSPRHYPVTKHRRRREKQRVLRGD